MLNSLVMVLVAQLPMQGILDEQSQRLLPPPLVVVQEKVVIKKIYIMTDKFGVDHENSDKTIVLKEVKEENQKPFRLKDAAGIEWTHQDREVLENFIVTRNALLGYRTPG